MAWQWPAFLANMQHSRFSSSEPVTAMNTSASSTPASDRVVMDEPLPENAHHIVGLPDMLHTCLVRIDNGHVVTLFTELPRQRCATLPPPTKTIFIE